MREALAAVDAEGRDIGDPTTFAARCLPTPLLQQIAQDVVRLDLHKQERAEAIAVIASDFGVSRRYVEVQIGRARQLYRQPQKLLPRSSNQCQRPTWRDL